MIDRANDKRMLIPRYRAVSRSLHRVIPISQIEKCPRGNLQFYEEGQRRVLSFEF